MTAISRPAGPQGGIYGVNNLVNFQKDTLGFLTSVGQTYGDIAYFRMAAFHFYFPHSAPDSGGFWEYRVILGDERRNELRNTTNRPP
ncbi:MAG: hypothetical protein MUE67_13240, partial [Anaerolineales bacterium]|nr:hypothetical protein [Anaerolineales bacterium]